MLTHLKQEILVRNFCIWLVILFFLLLYSNLSHTSEEKKIESLSLKDLSDLNDEEQKNAASGTSSETTVDTKFSSKPVTPNDFEKFAERLGLKEFTENKDESKKFYGMQKV